MLVSAYARFCFMISHPLHSGLRDYRLPGDPPRYHAFISYRAATDKESAEALTARLEAHGLRVWLDRDRLVAGDDWRREFCRALADSLVFVPIISPSAVMAWPTLTAASDCDNVLLEHRLAHELSDRGLCAKTIPVLLGDADSASLSGELRPYFDATADDFAPSAVAVDAVECELAGQVRELGLGELQTRGVCVSADYLWRARILAFQAAGRGAGGSVASLIAQAAEDVVVAVRRLPSRPALNAAQLEAANVLLRALIARTEVRLALERENAWLRAQRR